MENKGISYLKKRRKKKKKKKISVFPKHYRPSPECSRNIEDLASVFGEHRYLGFKVPLSKLVLHGIKCFQDTLKTGNMSRHQ